MSQQKIAKLKELLKDRREAEKVITKMHAHSAVYRLEAYKTITECTKQIEQIIDEL